MEEVLIIKNNIIKSGMLLIVGLGVAIVIYPVIHELGHSIIAVIVGAEIIEITLLPLPSILCNVRNVSEGGMILISIGGSLFPLLLAIIAPKCFWGWYSCFTIRWISLWSFIISEITVVLFCLGISFETEDVMHILKESQQYTWICLVFYLFLIVATSMLIVYSKPINRIISEMET